MRRFKNVAAKLRKYRWPALAVLLIAVAAAGGLVLRSHVRTHQDVIAQAAQINDICAVQPTYTCYKDELTSIVNKQSTEQATALVKRQYTKVQFVKSECHQLMHVVGRASYAHYNDLGTAFAHGDQFCWSGFYHGIMEQIANEKGSDYVIKNANTICQPVALKYKRYSFNDYNCVHGLGHGFMEALDGDLFKSLSACDALTDSWDRDSCYGGVFMQNIMNVQGPERYDPTNYPYLKADQPMYPCTAIDERYKGQCYLMQTSYALAIEGYDFSKVFDLCGQAGAYAATCYQSLGRDASGQSISDVQRTDAICRQGPTAEAQTNCIIGAVKDFVSYFHDDKRAYQLCAAAPDYVIQTCKTTVRGYYSTF
jgi:hypothetical protein